MAEDCGRESMAKAVEEMKVLPHFAQDGEVTNSFFSVGDN